MKQFESQVVSNKLIAAGYFEMQFGWSPGAEAPEPGQFVTVKSYGTADLILRRPFALSSFDESRGRAAIIYQRKGPATAALASKSPGDTIDLIAPLGNRFPPPQAAQGAAILVGGGVGLGPILFYGSKLARQGRSPVVVLGFRDAALVPDLARDEKRLGFRAEIATDDGSVGFRGTAVELLAHRRNDDPHWVAGAEMWTCGPNAMMAACHDFAAGAGIPCWVSMEQIMGCGVGACMGCTIPVFGESAYARVCTEGPIFPSGGIRWQELT